MATRSEVLLTLVRELADASDELRAFAERCELAKCDDDLRFDDLSPAAMAGVTGAMRVAVGTACGFGGGEDLFDSNHFVSGWEARAARKLVRRAA